DHRARVPDPRRGRHLRRVRRRDLRCLHAPPVRLIGAARPGGAGRLLATPSVVVADVVPLVRLGLATVLRSEGYTVVADVASARGVAKAVVEHGPDLAVVGAVNDLSIDELARQVREAPAQIRLCVLPGRAPRDTLADLLAVAVDGLVSRSVDPAE